LTDITALSNFEPPGGNFELKITENPNLTSLSGFEKLTYVNGTITIWRNSSLKNLESLSNLVSTHEIQIWDNPSLTSLQGLRNLKSSHDLSIMDNPNITSLEGLEGLESLDGGLIINRNTTLVNMKGLDNLLFIEEGLHIVGNNALTSLAGLESLTDIGENLYVSGNMMLSNLKGLDNLKTAGGLNINHNASLTDLTGLESLTSLKNSTIRIEENKSLVSLTGIDLIDPNTIQNLIVENNENLTVCDVRSVCMFIDIRPWYSIYWNAPGCDFIHEVRNACQSHFLESNGCCVFPNPSRDWFTIFFTLEENSLVKYEVLNLVGQIMEDEDLGTLEPGVHKVNYNSEEFPAGIYHYRITAGDKIQRGKMMVIR
jgi:hypothetical protein